MQVPAELELDFDVFYAQATFSYDAEDEGEGTFEEGQFMKIVGENEFGWWLSQNEEGKLGWVPSNFLVKVDYIPDPFKDNSAANSKVDVVREEEAKKPDNSAKVTVISAPAVATAPTAATVAAPVVTTPVAAVVTPPPAVVVTAKPLDIQMHSPKIERAPSDEPIITSKVDLTALAQSSKKVIAPATVANPTPVVSTPAPVKSEPVASTPAKTPATSTPAKTPIASVSPAQVSPPAVSVKIPSEQPKSVSSNPQDNVITPKFIVRPSVVIDSKVVEPEPPKPESTFSKAALANSIPTKATPRAPVEEKKDPVTPLSITTPRADDPSNGCNVCSKKLSGIQVKVDGIGMIHLSCFKCTVCKKSLAEESEDDPKLNAQGKLVCLDHLKSITSPAAAPAPSATQATPTSIASPPQTPAASTTPAASDTQTMSSTKNPCARCGAELGTGALVRALGKTFHRDCFVCRDCSKTFLNGKFHRVPNEDIPICVDCFKAKYAPVCAACKQPIVEGSSLKALDKTFHADCFRCPIGNHPLGKQSGLVKQVNGVICCADHLEQVIAQLETEHAAKKN